MGPFSTLCRTQLRLFSCRFQPPESIGPHLCFPGASPDKIWPLSAGEFPYFRAATYKSRFKLERRFEKLKDKNVVISGPFCAVSSNVICMHTLPPSAAMFVHFFPISVTHLLSLRAPFRISIPAHGSNGSAVRVRTVDVPAPEQLISEPLDQYLKRGSGSP